VATQNPLEFHGTFPLPESQLDRFMISATMGYPSPEYEISILREMRYAASVDGLKPVLTSEEVISLQEKADAVKIDEDLLAYVLEIINATRCSDRIALGASPRAGLALKQAAKAAAVCDGRDYVIPDDIKLLAVPVIAHRIIPGGSLADPIGRINKARQLLRDLLDEVPVPV
jgi:MoxR-like ATPase